MTAAVRRRHNWVRADHIQTGDLINFNGEYFTVHERLLVVDGAGICLIVAGVSSGFERRALLLTSRASAVEQLLDGA